MIKIKNPYVGMEGYQCFACSPDNENGLQMQFKEDGEYVICDWEPRGFMQGYVNVLHGGIQATLMDEIGSWVVQLKLRTAGMTSKLSTKYLKPVPVDKGAIRIRAKLMGTKRNLAEIKAELFCPDGNLCAEAEMTYFTFSVKVAQERLNYPGIQAFKEPDK
ncbi:MAG: PaaI family thioesterase [Bacteroidales bacterium]|nr:PaaI family thioesterase [Bacteroidales bacterium]